MNTKNEVKHTATPWVNVYELSIKTTDGTCAVGMPNDMEFAKCAVNSHDELLELAKMYLYSVQPSNPNYDSIMKTIAKAEGK